MRILLINPKYPVTFWSYKYALRFISKKASFPPLGLLTVSSLLPEDWEKKLVDMNVNPLTDKNILWADYVFIGGMAIQKSSAIKVIEKCKKFGKRIVAGGPLFTMEYEDFDEMVDYFVLDEGEATIPLFLKDLESSKIKHIYRAKKFPDIEKSPVPDWKLVNLKKYASMNIQYSRGCPYNCDFCNVTLLNGHRPRTKNKQQILNELNRLYSLGWKGPIFFVDDNFIGNKKKLKNEILPAIIEWRNRKKFNFSFTTEVSINIADDDELLRLMAEAGFDNVFVGIETPNEESLVECSKFQNKGRDLTKSVKKIQKFGMQVLGGFIVGFDNDPPSIFERQINFIQKSGIVTAMVGLLNAPKGTKLYKRLKKENRITGNISGDNTDCSINFIPKMNYEVLLNGYKKILKTIYSPINYYERIKIFLREYKPLDRKISKPNFSEIMAFLKSIWFLGIKGKERFHFWKLLFWTILKKPRLFKTSITLAIYGFHFRKIYESYV